MVCYNVFQINLGDSSWWPRSQCYTYVCCWLLFSLERNKYLELYCIGTYVTINNIYKWLWYLLVQSWALSSIRAKEFCFNIRSRGLQIQVPFGSELSVVIQGFPLNCAFSLKFCDFSELCRARPESGIFKKKSEKTQYLMNTLYIPAKEFC